MDLVNPLRTVAPTVDADVLRVLARTHAGLTGARVAALAERSYAQVRHVLHRLVDHGLVLAERHGNGVVYWLNREHVLATSLEVMAGALDALEASIAQRAASWDPAPRAVVVFGSFARRDGEPESDIDLLLVRPDEVDEDDAAWRRQRHELVRHVEAAAGNTVQVVEMSVRELQDAVDAELPLVSALRRDGRVLAGASARSLFAPRAGATR